MIADFITQHLGELVTAIIAGFGGWLFQRKQKHAELEALKANNSQRIVDLYQEALGDLKSRYDEKFSELHKEVEQLRRNVELWKGKYRDLKSEFEKYRQKHP